MLIAKMMAELPHNVLRLLAFGSILTGCAGQPTQPTQPTGTARFEAGVELPEGAGREILVDSCLNCHELSALSLFKGFYGRDQWHSLVLTMQQNGAELDAAEIEIVTDYLGRYFGPDSR